MPETDFDVNKFTAEVFTQAAEHALKNVSAPLKRRVRRTLQAVGDAYRPFLLKTYKRVETIRTFLRPTESVDLLAHYVPVDLRTNSRELSIEDLISSLADGGRFVISALAGSGKSVLMRFIALSFFHSPRGRIPLFFELRSLNHDSPLTLLESIHEYYRGNSNITFDDFLDTLRKGYFTLILDGFDEISPPNRAAIESQIFRLIRDFDDVPIIISGRHDERFNSWEGFSHFYLKEMTLKQTRELISKSNYDEDVKNIFLDRLSEDFFERHQSFLSNPLLAIMMMLTFEGYAEIPDSLHEFYRIAFDTLLRRHDAMKGQFLRESHSGCSTEQFKQIFSSFCLLTYVKSAFSFDRDKALAYLNAAICQQGLEKSPEIVLFDLIESICLLQEEGFEISFVHRSFQEYFSAVFIANSGTGFVQKYLDEGEFRTFDNVLPMLMGIAQQRVESEWAIDRINDICSRFPKSERGVLDFYLACYPEFEFAPVHSGSIALTKIFPTKLSREYGIIRSLYSEEFYSGNDDNDSGHNTWEERISACLQDMEAAGNPFLEGYTESLKELSPDVEKRMGPKFNIKCDDSCELLYAAMFGPQMGWILEGIYRVQTLQRERQDRSNSFLGEVFRSSEI